MFENNPTIVIINGANWIGSELVKLITANKGNVIVVDDFNNVNIPFIKRFSDNKKFVFIERDKVETLNKSFTKIKYMIHLKNDFDSKNNDISSKEFIKETKFIDEVLTIALEKNSTYILTTSMHLHKDFILKQNHTKQSDSAYNESELQDYLERTVIEYTQKTGLNGRIVRLGNIFGPEMPIEKDEVLKQVFSDAIFRDEIRIYGDGLEFMYYVYLTDAVQGILKVLFNPSTRGQIYSITSPEEISILSLVNKIIALQPRARKIRFLKPKSNRDPLYERAYIPDPNITEIGWKPLVSFDRGLKIILDYFLKESNQQIPEETKTSSEPAHEIAINFNLPDTTTHFEDDSTNQFTDFYKKLNSQDSPIYNIKDRKLITPPKNPIDDLRPRSSFEYFKSGFLIFLSFTVIGFITVPTANMFYFFYKFDQASTKVKTKVVEEKYDSTISDSNLERSFNETSYPIIWIFELIGQEKAINSIQRASAGVDKAEDAYQYILKENLQVYILNKSQKLSQSDITKINNLLIILNASEKDLKDNQDLNIPLSSNENIKEIYDWVVENKTHFENLLKGG